MLVRIGWFTLSTEYCTSSFRQVGNAVFGKYLASQGPGPLQSGEHAIQYTPLAKRKNFLLWPFATIVKF